MLDEYPIFDPDALPRVISRADARRRGMSDAAIDNRVARGAWRRQLPRTYRVGPTVMPQDRLLAAVLYAGSESALSGAAALAAWGVPKATVPERVLVLVPMARFTKSVDWVRVRRTDRAFDSNSWYTPRRADVARATADLALETRRLDDVRSLVARVVQSGRCAIAELGAELDSGPRRGSKHLRQALEEVGWGAASAPEAKAATILRRAGLTGFVQNAELVLPDRSRRVVDFYWPELRACLEIDSVEWHFDRRDWAGTWDRHLALTKFGYSVIHRPPSALDSEARFVRDVREWLVGRKADLRRGLTG
ncbi:MAG: hypothetical protein ACR2LX_04130 [Jatrophihabitans sp.]